MDSQPVGVTLSDLTRGPGITANLGADSFNSRSFTLGGTPDLNDYYQLSLAPAPGFVLNATDLDFSQRRSATGPQTLQLRSSLDGFGTAVTTLALPADTNTHRVEIFLPPDFLGLTAPVTFRLYGYNATNSNGTWRLGVSDADNPNNYPANFQVTGSVTPVPEPGTLALVLAAGACLAVVRRRRQPAAR